MGEGSIQGILELSAGRSGADEICSADRLRRPASRHRQAEKGLDGGVYELALPHRGDAYRAVYAVKIGADLWVVHAFQKKSTQGIKTPKHEIDVIRERLKRIREL